MITLPTQFQGDIVNYVTLIQADLGGANVRWTTGALPVTVGGSEYTPSNPLIQLFPPEDAEGGIGRDVFSFTMSDPDTAVINRMLSQGWTGRSIAVRLLANTALFNLYQGFLTGASHANGVTQVLASGELSKLEASKQRRTTQESQAAIDSTDTSFNFTKNTPRIIWGRSP